MNEGVPLTSLFLSWGIWLATVESRRLVWLVDNAYAEHTTRPVEKVVSNVYASFAQGGWCKSGDQCSQSRCSLLRFCDYVNSWRGHEMHYPVPQNRAAWENNISWKGKWLYVFHPFWSDAFISSPHPPPRFPAPGVYFVLMISHHFRQRMNLLQRSLWTRRKVMLRMKLQPATGNTLQASFIFCFYILLSVRKNSRALVAVMHIHL